MKRIMILAALATMAVSCNFVRVKEGALDKLMNNNVVVGAIGYEETVTASDSTVTRTYQVGTFSEIECNGAAEIYYTAADSCSLEITLPESLVDVLKVSVDGDELCIGFKKTVKLNGKKVIVRITSPQMSSMDLSGAVKFIADTPVTAEKFSADVSGAADFDVKGIVADEICLDLSGAVEGEISGLKCVDLDVEVSGASNLKLSGSADKASVSISGAGSIDARELICQDIDTEVSGAGKIKTAK